MPNELYILAGATVGAFAAYITAKITTGAQMNIARLNADKDIKLQRDRLVEERLKNEIFVERGKLEILHRTLSRIALENSQTISYMQSEANLPIEDFRTRYLENCERLHEAMGIADIYYPKMGTKLREIFAQSNIFWGNQENLLRTDITSSRDSWNSLLSIVLEASRAIESRAYQLQDEIACRAKHLSESIA